MNNERRIRHGVKCLLLIGGAAGLLFALWPRERHLLQQATRVVSARTWIDKTDDDFQTLGHAYLWQSPYQLLIFRNTSDLSQLFSYRAARLDTRSGIETPLPQFSQALNRYVAYPGLWSLSPDERQLLAGISTAYHAQYVVVSLDGLRSIRRDDMDDTMVGSEDHADEALWMPDSRQWVEFVVNRNGRTHYRLHGLDGKDTDGILAPGPFDQPIGITPDACVVTLRLKNNRLCWSLYSLRRDTERRRSFSAAFPANAGELQEAVLSPQGDRLACFIQTRGESRLRRFLQRFFHAVFPVPSIETSLWVCRIDGSGLHEIGSLSGKSASDLQWTPDGKRLSFLCRDTLWTVATGQ